MVYDTFTDLLNGRYIVLLWSWDSIVSGCQLRHGVRKNNNYFNLLTNASFIVLQTAGHRRAGWSAGQTAFVSGLRVYLLLNDLIPM